MPWEKQNGISCHGAKRLLTKPGGLKRARGIRKRDEIPCSSMCSAWRSALAWPCGIEKVTAHLTITVFLLYSDNNAGEAPLTVTCSSPILRSTTSYIPRTRSGQTFLLQEFPGYRRLGVTAKERVVGDELEDYYAARRATLDQQFQALPPAGTDAYWQSIESPRETPLPPEVLCRCLRERLSAEAKEDALRIFDVLFPQAQATFQHWAVKFVGLSRAGSGSSLVEDLESECYIALWKELASGKPTFLLEHFQHALKRMAQHTAHRFLEREGLWKRPGVEQSTRIQRSDLDSLEAAKDQEPEGPLADTLADRRSQLPPGERELLLDLEMLLDQLDTTSRLLIFRYYYGGYTQQEIAQEFGMTDRTVRNRIEKLLAYLRAHLGERGEQHG